jgi:hypothetical protein
MRRAIDATVPASSNNAGTGSATPNTACTCSSKLAPRSESPPSMKKSASRSTFATRSVAAQSAPSATSSGEGGEASTSPFSIIDALSKPTCSASAARRTLPVSVRGSVSTNHTRRGA